MVMASQRPWCGKLSRSDMVALTNELVVKRRKKVSEVTETRQRVELMVGKTSNPIELSSKIKFL